MQCLFQVNRYFLFSDGAQHRSRRLETCLHFFSAQKVRFLQYFFLKIQNFQIPARLLIVHRHSHREPDSKDHFPWEPANNARSACLTGESLSATARRWTFRTDHHQYRLDDLKVGEGWGSAEEGRFRARAIVHVVARCRGDDGEVEDGGYEKD